ncbi:MAG: hypothetical protein ACE5GJ_08580 [Gemmatimonadota bacterium]
MKGIMNFIGMTAGGAVGWALGARISIFTAYVTSVLGTAIGLYAMTRLLRNIMP